jgi:hypothetical protein
MFTSNQETNMQTLADRYVAIWNEPDADARRATVAALWTPEGATLHRLIEARGHEALEARVAGAHEKWVRDRGYTFRSRHNAVGHHDVVKFNWEMGPPSGGEVVSVGLDYCLLDADGRMRCTYQFIVPGAPASTEVAALVERYLAVWNESDSSARRRQVVELWEEDGAHVLPSAEIRGHAAIEAEIVRTYDAAIAKGFIFTADDVEGHHDVVRFDWAMRPSADGPAAATGSTLIVLDADGRIRRDYQFD